jgi:hypothetical protein
MAILTNGIFFTGALGKMSAYKIKGSDKIILRTKGGASKTDIRESPRFARTRENNTEFGGCSYASKGIRQVLYPIKHLADYNFTATLHKLARSIQVLDEVSDRGKRNIFLSRHHYLLEGFPLNKKNTFDSVLRHPVYGTIERETGSVEIQLPPLKSGLNLLIPWPYPFYRFIVTFGAVADVVHQEDTYMRSENKLWANSVSTAWQPVRQSQEAQTIELMLPNLEALDDTKTLIAGIGIEMGMPISNQVMERVKYAGCAKILATG